MKKIIFTSLIITVIAFSLFAVVINRAHSPEKVNSNSGASSEDLELITKIEATCFDTEIPEVENYFVYKCQKQTEFTFKSHYDTTFVFKLYINDENNNFIDVIGYKSFSLDSGSTVSFSRSEIVEMGLPEKNLPGKYKLEILFEFGTDKNAVQHKAGTSEDGTYSWTRSPNVSVESSDYENPQDITVFKLTAPIDPCQPAFTFAGDEKQHTEAYTRGEPIVHTWDLKNVGTCESTQQYWKLDKIFSVGEETNGVPSYTEITDIENFRYKYFADDAGTEFYSQHDVPHTRTKNPDGTYKQNHVYAGNTFTGKIVFSIAPEEAGKYMLTYKRYTDVNNTPENLEDDVAVLAPSCGDEFSYLSVTVDIEDCATTYPEQLTMEDCISAPETIKRTTAGNFSFSVKNTSCVNFHTYLEVFAVNNNTQEETTIWTINNNDERIYMEAGETYSYSKTFPVTLLPGTYTLKLQYNSDKNSTDENFEVIEGSCSWPEIVVIDNVSAPNQFILNYPGSFFTPPPPEEPMLIDETQPLFTFDRMPNAASNPNDNGIAYYLAVYEKDENGEKGIRIHEWVLTDPAAINGGVQLLPADLNLEEKKEYIFTGYVYNDEDPQVKILPDNELHFAVVSYVPPLCNPYTDKNDNGELFSEENWPEATKATCFWEGKGIVSPQDRSDATNPDNTRSVNPFDILIREDGTKITTMSLFGDYASAQETFYCENFPSPLLDMREQYINYYRHAKFLTYWKYKDNTVPLIGISGNFEGGRAFRRDYFVKMILEAYDVDVFESANYLDDNQYKQWALNNGIVALIDNEPATEEISSINSPLWEDDIPRYQAFVWLYRLHQYMDDQGTLPTQADLTDPDHFFMPYHYNIDEKNDRPAMAEGNFSVWGANGISFPGIGMNLAVAPKYESPAPEMPANFYPDAMKPLGDYWTHSLHSFITKIEGYSYTNDLGTVSSGDHYLLYWPGSLTPDVLDENFQPINVSNKYNVTVSGDDVIISPTPADIIYTFRKYGDYWMLKEIEDKNGNKITFIYGEDGYPIYRLTRVEGTEIKSGGYTSRAFYFNYSSKGETANLESILTPHDVNWEGIYFDYTDGMLSEYTDILGETTKYFYLLKQDGPNGKRLLNRIQMPKGNYIDYTYNGFKMKAKKTTDGNGISRTASIDPNTMVTTTTITDGLSSITEKADEEGKVFEIVRTLSNGNEEKTTREFNDSNNPNLPTDISLRNGEIDIHYDYTDFGQVDKVIMQAGSVTITEDWEFVNNRVISYTDPENNTTTFTRDGNGNIIAVTDAMGNTTTLNLTSRGLLTSYVSPYNNLTYTFTHNEFGQVTSVTAPSVDGQTIQSTSHYDQWGNLEWTEDPEGLRTTFDMEINGLLNSVTNHANETVSYGYDANYNLTDVYAPNGGHTELGYDFAKDVLISQSYEANGDPMTTSFDYHDNGMLKKITDAEGQVFDIHYHEDANGDMTTLPEDDGYIVYAYDTYDRPKKATLKDNPGIYIEYTQYDGLDRLTEYEVHYPDNSYYTFGLRYDNNSNIVKRIYPGGKDVDYEYDKNDRLVKVTDWNNNEYTATYYPDGVIKRIDYPNDTYKRFERDEAGRVKGYYVYHSEGNGIIYTANMTLDKRGYITAVDETDMFTTPPLLPNVDISFTPDNQSNSNRIVSETNNLTGETTNYAFDNNGNQTAGAAFQNYSWNKVNQLTGIESTDGTWNAQYVYDPLGNRIQATRNGVKTKYAVDITGIGNILFEETNGERTFYVHGFGLMARIKGEGTNAVTRYYHTDIRGSVIAMTDEGGNITHKYSYLTYGDIAQIEEEDYNPFRYVGGYGVMHETDSLYFMRARYYNVHSKRFISNDPIWNTNLYAYAEGNPIMGIDPTGLYTYQDYGLLSAQYGVEEANDMINLSLSKQIAEYNNAYRCETTVNFGKSWSDTGKELEIAQVYGGHIGKKVEIGISSSDFSTQSTNKEWYSNTYLGVSIGGNWKVISLGLNEEAGFYIASVNEKGTTTEEIKSEMYEIEVARYQTGTLYYEEQRKRKYIKTFCGTYRSGFEQVGFVKSYIYRIDPELKIHNASSQGIYYK